MLGPLALAFSLLSLPTFVNTVSRFSCRCCCCALQSPHTVLPCLTRFHPHPNPIPSQVTQLVAPQGLLPRSLPRRRLVKHRLIPRACLSQTSTHPPTADEAHLRAAPRSSYCYGAPQRRPQVLRSVELGRRPHFHDLGHTIDSHTTPHLTSPHLTASPPPLATRAATLSGASVALAHLPHICARPTRP